MSDRRGLFLTRQAPADAWVRSCLISGPLPAVEISKIIVRKDVIQPQVPLTVTLLRLGPNQQVYRRRLPPCGWHGDFGNRSLSWLDGRNDDAARVLELGEDIAR